MVERIISHKSEVQEPLWNTVIKGPCFISSPTFLFLNPMKVALHDSQLEISLFPLMLDLAALSCVWKPHFPVIQLSSDRLFFVNLRYEHQVGGACEWSPLWGHTESTIEQAVHSCVFWVVCSLSINSSLFETLACLIWMFVQEPWSVRSISASTTLSNILWVGIVAQLSFNLKRIQINKRPSDGEMLINNTGWRERDTVCRHRRERGERISLWFCPDLVHQSSFLPCVLGIAAVLLLQYSCTQSCSQHFRGLYTSLHSMLQVVDLSFVR